MNQGKAFEQQFKESVPPEFFIHRIGDPAQSFNPDSLTRFSIKNPFDYIMYDRKILYALELKSTADTLMSFAKYDGPTQKMIKFHQIESLSSAKEKGLLAGFLLEFRSADTVYFLEISDFMKFSKSTSKASIKPSDIIGMRHIKVPRYKKRVKYSYDILEFSRICYDMYFEELQ